jgi:hypothetical protein
MEDGLEQIRETIRTELMGMVYPPVPMNLVTLQQLPGQFSMQIAV